MSAHEPRWRRYLGFFGPDPDADIDAELGFHLEQLEADLRAAGLSPADARLAARERFGDVSDLRRRLRRQDAKRLSRLRRAELLADLAQDVRYAVRRLRQQPAFAAAVIGILALGVGATTAMFTAVDAALLRPLPFERPDELVELRGVVLPFQEEMTERHEPAPRMVDLLDVAGLGSHFSHVAGYAVGGLNLSDADQPVRVRVGVVTADFFATLGVGPVRGRTFVAEEGRPDGPRVVVLSHGLWQRRFGAADVLGRAVPLNGRAYTVVGVMPRGFGFPQDCDFWIPLTTPTTRETFEPFRGWLPSRVVARLAPGVSPEAGAVRLRALWEQIAGPPDPSGRRTNVSEELEAVREVTLAPLQRELTGNRATALLVLLGATALLLLIACVNVTNLLLSRAAARRREIAVRAVLGATRGRVVRQLLTESILLALAGAVLGFIVAQATVGLAREVMPPSLEGLAPPRLDLRVLLFGTTLATLSGLGFGLWPALGISRGQHSETLKAGGGLGATPGRAGRVRRVLVAAELALALVLLIGAGLMLRSFQVLLATDPGVAADRVGTLELTFARGQGAAFRLQTIDAILERLDQAPEIDAAGVINDLPLRGSSGISIGFEADGGVNRGMYFARLLQASGGFFSAMGIPLRSGRFFTRSDDSLAPRVAIVSEQLARDKWPDQDALGRTFRWGGDSIPYTVVGVVGDVRENALDKAPPPAMYFPAHALTPNNLALVARGSLPPGALLARLQDAVRAADPAQAVFNVRMMDEVISRSVAPRRTSTVLIGAFGVLALVLAAAGVYAVVASAVAQRTRELGIRAALGATGGALVGLMAREMVVTVLFGVAAGLGAAWTASRVLSTLVYGVTTHDPVTFVVAPLALLVPVLAATLVPARRALRLNPMDVIRAD